MVESVGTPGGAANPESTQTLQLPVFQPKRTCTLCPLHESARNPGISTRKLFTSATGSGIALVVIGEKPGYAEDLANKHFVGESGDILNNKLLKGSGIRDLCDVYLTNAVRCRPPAKATVTVTQFKACQPYLIDDLKLLQSRYERVILLGAGAGAAKTLRNSSLDAALGHQGEATLLGIPTFFTFNPFVLAPGKDPSKLDAVIDHLTLLKEFIETGALKHTLQMPDLEIAVSNPGHQISLLSLDIETYGAVKGLPRQTVFQPQRSIVTDGVRPEDLVQTVALAWETPDGSMRTSVYNVTRKDHRQALNTFLIKTWMHSVGQEKRLTLLGMNMPFDVMFLRAWNNFYRTLLIRSRTELRDLAITNYLHSEVRPERSLKSITPLLSITDYEDELSLRAGERYDGPDDERLWYYNAKDAVATLIAYRALEERIRGDFPDTGKLSDYCLDWYDHLLWFAIESSEAGIAIDREAIERLDTRLDRQCRNISNVIRDWWGAPVRGEGSQRYLQGVAERSANTADLLNDARLVRTEKTDKVSTKGENLNLFAETLPKGSREHKEVSLLRKFREKSKLLTSFTGPLLRGRQLSKKVTSYAGVILPDGLVHPTWYVVPSQFEDASSGGTIQGRITCLTGDTELYTDRGIERLDQVVEGGSSKVVTLDESGKFEFVQPTHYLKFDESDVYEIKLRGRQKGVIVTATLDHRWVTFHGEFITTKELTPGTRLRHVAFTVKGGYPHLRWRYRGGENQAPLHRLAAESHYGPLKSEEEVHHKDENRKNWAIENLKVLTRSEHRQLHGQKRCRKITFQCQYCHASVTRRRSIHRHKFCSRSCFVEFSKCQPNGFNYVVESVTFKGREKTYCLTVPPNETFLLANGLLSGNCKNPAVMTFPEIVKHCLTTRFAPGLFIGDDLSQIELRTGALLSGDSRMIEEYQGGIDRHLETAMLVLRAYAKATRDRWASNTVAAYDAGQVDKSYDGINKWRQLGKTLNFLMLFKGGARKAQETAARDLGVFLPLDVWKAAIDGYQRRYPEFIDWQFQLLETARTKGYLEVPFTGQTRMFLGGRRGTNAAINEIVNMPIQTVAANTMISAHRKATEGFRNAGLQAISSLIIYDAMYVELPAQEERQVRSILDGAMTEPPYWIDIQNQLGRTVPLEHDVEVLCEKPEEPESVQTSLFLGVGAG